jgi:hypothetical protein
MSETVAIDNGPLALKDLEYIATHLSKEASEQMKLYRVDDVFTALVRNLQSRGVIEAGIFRLESTQDPLAVYGVRLKQDYLDLFLLLSERALEHYRGFSLRARKWLKVQSKPVRCTLPSISTQTLRMVDLWGFKEISRIQDSLGVYITFERSNDERNPQ